MELVFVPQGDPTELDGQKYNLTIDGDVTMIYVSEKGYQLALASFGEEVYRTVMNTELNVTRQYGVDMDAFMDLVNQTLLPSEV